MADRPDPEPPRLTESGDPAMSRLLASARAGGQSPRIGAQQRVWRSLIGASTPSRARWIVPAVAVAGVSLALIVFLPTSPKAPAASPQPFATLALASGDVQATHADAAWAVAQVGERLPNGSQLRTAGNSRAYTRFSSAGALFGEGTRASLSRSGAGIEVQLEEGAVALAVRKGAGGFVVRAQAYTVEVTGTVFQVKVGAERTVEVYVQEGVVRVRGPSTDLELHAGDSWSSRSGQGHGAMPQTEVAVARGLAAATGDEAPLRVAGPVGAEISIDGVTLGTAPLAVLERLGAHEVVAVHHGTRVAAQTVLGSLGAVFELAEPPLPALAPPAEKPQALAPGEVDAAAPLQQKLKGTLTAAERDTAGYELARLLSRRGRHAEAIGLYEKLAAGKGAWAEPALYEVGRLRLRYLSDPSGSVSAFADYRRRYPRGALAPEVALSSIEAQLARGADEEALREMDAFLISFAASERIDDVRFVRATVRRDRGDCAAALTDYLLLTRNARHGDDALYFAAYCEQQGEDPGAARRHLSEYLLRYPAGRHLGEARAALGGQ